MRDLVLIKQDPQKNRRISSRTVAAGEKSVAEIIECDGFSNTSVMTYGLCNLAGLSILSFISFTPSASVHVLVPLGTLVHRGKAYAEQGMQDRDQVSDEAGRGVVFLWF